MVDAAYRVHTTLGPGLLELVYHAVLAHELTQRGLRIASEQAIPVIYGTIRIDIGFRADLIVEDRVIVEIKSVECLAPVHKKQLLTYLRLADKRLGLLINFNANLIKDGITRHRQWTGRRVSRKVARTPRKHVKLSQKSIGRKSGLMKICANSDRFEQLSSRCLYLSFFNSTITTSIGFDPALTSACIKPGAIAGIQYAFPASQTCVSLFPSGSTSFNVPLLSAIAMRG